MKHNYHFILLCLMGSVLLSWDLSGAEMKMKIEGKGGKTVKVFSVDKNNFEEKPLIEKDEKQWKEQLTDEQFSVARKGGTERPFSYKDLSNKKAGVYKCVCCGNDLFVSDHKYDSKTGWPSFWKPVAEENIGTKEDRSLFAKRIEVHCVRCGCHLGHVFSDGPEPTGLRYCINGAALTFDNKEKEE